MFFVSVHFVVCLPCLYFTLYALQQNATLTNREVSNSSADPANKAKLILLLGGFNNTGELESQLKRISKPPISSEPLHALMIMECHQHSYTVQRLSVDMHTHTKHVHKCLHTYPTMCSKSNERVSFPLVTHAHTHLILCSQKATFFFHLTFFPKCILQ